MYHDGTQTLIVHTPSLNIGRPSRRVSIPSGRAVSVHTPSPRVAIESDRLNSCELCVRHLWYVYSHPRSLTIQTLTDDFYGMRMPFFDVHLCVGTPRGLKQAVRNGLMWFTDFGFFALTAGSASIRVPV